MKPLQLGILALVSLGLVGYTIFSMVTAEPARPRTSAAQDVGPKRRAGPRGAGEEAPIVRLARATRSPSADLDTIPAPDDDDDDAAAAMQINEEEGPPVDARPIPRAVAEATFESLISQLEDLEPGSLGTVERERLYRSVSDAFTSLSMHLGDDDTAALEDAYTRMQDEMRRLKLQRPKFQPGAVDFER